ncbi:MAG: lipoprotein signal peptidase [Chitinophagaceae bacterium]
MKYRSAVIVVIVIVILDQVLKFWVKAHMYIGQEYNILGHWFRIQFIQNEGMAYGISLGNSDGKILLTLLRLVAVIIGFFILKRLTRQKYPKGLIICGALIIAGAMGNLVDSMFYGLIFSASTVTQLAHFLPAGGGYAGFLHGKVVDMLYFPIYQGFLPEWIPFVGGEHFEFFQYVFNISDASISVGVIVILIFQKKFFKHPVGVRSKK